MRIQPAVGVVVDHATGRTGEPDAGGEHEQDPPRRRAAGRQPQRPPGRPQQQQHADRPIAAGQFPVLAQTLAPARRRGSFKTFVAHLRRISGGGDGARLHPTRRRHRPILPPRRQRAVARRPCHPPDFTRSENAHWAARRLRVSYAVCAPVAQPDRVVASEAIGRGFESLRARHFLPALGDRGADRTQTPSLWQCLRTLAAPLAQPIFSWFPRPAWLSCPLSAH